MSGAAPPIAAGRGRGADVLTRLQGRRMAGALVAAHSAEIRGLADRVREIIRTTLDET